MSMRDKLKKTKPPEVDLSDIELVPHWYTGDDIPITWEPNEIRRMRKKTIRQNFKLGTITKEQYKGHLNDI